MLNIRKCIVCGT